MIKSRSPAGMNCRSAAFAIAKDGLAKSNLRCGSANATFTTGEQAHELPRAIADDTQVPVNPAE